MLKERSLKKFLRRQFALHARNYSVSEAMSGNRMLVRPFVCGNCCVCCDPCCQQSKVDAAEYYTVEERQLAALVESEKLKVNFKPKILSYFSNYGIICVIRPSSDLLE